MKRKLLILIICISSMGSIYSQETEKYVSQGDKALLNGFYEVALNNYLKALEINSKHKKAYQKIIEIVDSIKSENELSADSFDYFYPDVYCAISTYLNNSKSNNAEFFIKMGDFFWNIDKLNRRYDNCGRIDHENAIKLYEKALKINPRSAKANERMGKIYNDETYFLKALEFDPCSFDAISSLTFKYIFAEEYSKAIICCQNALKKDPNFVFAYERLGLAYYNKGCYSVNKEDYIKSIKSFQKAKELVIKADKKSIHKVSVLNTDIARSSHNLAIIYFDEGDYNNARNYYYKLIGYYDHAYFKLGVCYFLIEDYSKAIISFKKYLSSIEEDDSEETAKKIAEVMENIEIAEEKLKEKRNLQQNTYQNRPKQTQTGGLKKDPNFKVK